MIEPHSATATAESLPPIRKQLVLTCDPQRAFAVFTGDIGDWWPLASHSVGGTSAITVAIEGRVGGRLFETTKDGSEHVWGSVTRWQPPHGLAFTWHPGRAAETAQLVELDFEAAADGTVVTLVHSGWATLGARAEKQHPGYVAGWELVFSSCYAAAAE